MSTQKRVGGYVYREQVARGRRALAVTREYVRRLLDERPGAAQTAMYLAQVGLAVGEAEAALTVLDEIGRGQRMGNG
jgi:thioredoxin-like negative regulator of GroEL